LRWSWGSLISSRSHRTRGFGHCEA
jgi:hypothetical protein